VGVV